MLDMVAYELGLEIGYIYIYWLQQGFIYGSLLGLLFGLILGLIWGNELGIKYVWRVGVDHSKKEHIKLVKRFKKGGRIE